MGEKIFIAVTNLDVIAPTLFPNVKIGMSVGFRNATTFSSNIYLNNLDGTTTAKRKARSSSRYRQPAAWAAATPTSAASRATTRSTLATPPA
jgi:hypothetical protein